MDPIYLGLSEDGIHGNPIWESYGNPMGTMGMGVQHEGFLEFEKTFGASGHMPFDPYTGPST
jgi:hypothetical protein